MATLQIEVKPQGPPFGKPNMGNRLLFALGGGGLLLPGAAQIVKCRSTGTVSTARNHPLPGKENRKDGPEWGIWVWVRTRAMVLRQGRAKWRG